MAKKMKGLARKQCRPPKRYKTDENVGGGKDRLEGHGKLACEAPIENAAPKKEGFNCWKTSKRAAKAGTRRWGKGRTTHS